MPAYYDWRAWGDRDLLAADELVRDDFAARGTGLSATRDDLAAIDERVRDLAEAARAGAFRGLWPLLAADQGLGAEDPRDRWRVRGLAELSWFGLRGDGRGFRVWDPVKLRRHLHRLQALRLLVPEHEREGLDLVWEAMYWADADLRGWEQLLTATGKDQAPDALLAALLALIRTRCGGWPAVDIDPDLFGFVHLTRPDGGEVWFDLSHDDGRSSCSLVHHPDPQRTGYLVPTVVEWSHPELLGAFTEFLQEAGLDPRPPAWPLDTPPAGS